MSLVIGISNVGPAQDEKKQHATNATYCNKCDSLLHFASIGYTLLHFATDLNRKLQTCSGMVRDFIETASVITLKYPKECKTMQEEFQRSCH
jgi:hypothetical protein